MRLSKLTDVEDTDYQAFSCPKILWVSAFPLYMGAKIVGWVYIHDERHHTNSSLRIQNQREGHREKTPGAFTQIRSHACIIISLSIKWH